VESENEPEKAKMVVGKEANTIRRMQRVMKMRTLITVTVNAWALFSLN
jgi:hypothetical protein